MKANFVQCAFCSGHEKLSAEAADKIRFWIDMYSPQASHPLRGELENIRNVILNMAEREEPKEEYTPPVCPTPQKRKYNNAMHALTDGRKYHQHPYNCACGYWHLSKQAPSDHAAKINAPAADANEFEQEEPLDPLLS